WTEGTVSGRLARARDLLRSRLSRRGLAVSVGTLAAVLSPEGATAAVPAALAESALRMAALFPAGEGARGAGAGRIHALTEKVVRTMVLNKLKTAAAVALLAAVALGAGGFLYQTQAQQPAGEQKQRVAPGQPPAEPAGRLKDQPAAAEGKKGGPLLRVPMPERTMMTVALSANGKLLAVARQDGTTVQLWDVATGTEHTLRGHAFSVTALAFS